MKTKLPRWLAIVLILEVGLVHYFTAQHEFEEAAILGYLFMANFLGALLAAYGIYRQKGWGWGLGLAIAAGSLSGYIWSRTTGLPGLEAEPWLNAWGVTCLAAESLFILLALTRPRQASSPAPSPAVPSNRAIRYLAPTAVLLTLILVNFATFQLDVLFPAEGHEHSLSLAEIQQLPVISMDTLEQQYGVQVSLVAVSALDSIIDVRLHVVDVEKADALLENHGALLVGDRLIFAANMHSHALKQNKPYFVFYPNQQQAIRPGTPVSLVFGDVRLEPIVAR